MAIVLLGNNVVQKHESRRLIQVDNVMVLEINIPGFGGIRIEHVVFDLNGTLAVDGHIPQSTRERLRVLAGRVSLVVMTADTHGTLDQVIGDLPVKAQRIAGAIGASEKRALVEMLGAQQTIAVGNGRNDVEMLEAAVKGGKDKVGVLGVTVLTSILNEDLESAGFRKIFYDDLTRLVIKRAGMAKQAGCKGIVCSALEVRMIKETFGQDFIAVTPGIRPGWDVHGKNDQRRVTTPARAIENGSDYLVIGRPIRDAKDPKDAAVRIAEEIETVL